MTGKEPFPERTAVAAVEVSGGHPVSFRDLIEKAPIGVFVVAGDGHVLDCNEAFLAMVGAPRERVIGFDLLHSPKDPALVPYLQRALGGERVEFETPYTSTTGNRSGVYLYIFEPLGAEEHGDARLLCYAQDVAHLRIVEAANEALRLSEEKFSKAFRDGPDPMILSSIANGRTLEINEAFTRCFGYTPDEVIGRTTLEFGLWADEQQRVTTAALMRERGSLSNHEVEFRCKDGSIRTVLGSASQIDIDAVPHWLVQFRDITEHKRMLHEIENQARTDYLTGLANRRHFIEQAERELLRARRYARPLSLLMLDLDNFKRLNDTYGHLAGDRVLQQVGAVCTELLREIDLMARIGGEEFAILLPETPLSRAEQVAERVRKAVASIIVASDVGAAVSTTVSIGIITNTSSADTLNGLLGAADRALYQAKQAGRNCWRTASA